MSSESSSRTTPLRARALARFHSQAASLPAPKSPSQVQSLLHELQVRQIELEMQNEELLDAMARTQADLLRYSDLYAFAPAGLFKIDRSGVVVQSNLMGVRLLGVDRSTVAGTRLQALLGEADARSVDRLVKLALDGQCPRAIDVQLSRLGPPQRTVRVEASLSPDGQACCMSMVDISDRVRLEQARYRAADLALQRQADEASRRAKSTFISCMSHELRTPLNAILGFTQLLQMDREHPLDALQGQRVQAMLVASKQLLQLVDDVLDLAQIEGGHVQLDNTLIKVHPVIEEAMRLMAPVLEGSGLTVSVESLPASGLKEAVIWADEKRLLQVLVNLLTNAIKYNVPDGSVRIIVDETQAQTTRIAVADTGRGMSEEQLAGVFEPFNRVGQERSNIPGIGIGLAITRWLVDIMGGTLEVHSKPGEGSRFDVVLRAGDQAPRRPLAMANPKADKGFDVLYIEDNSLNAKLMGEVVSLQPGCRMHLAGTVADGLAMAARLNPQMVMFDLNLPDGEGLAVLHRLRAAQGMQDARFVVVSTDTAPDQVDAALSAGADAYMAKPINVLEVLRLLARAA